MLWLLTLRYIEERVKRDGAFVPRVQPGEDPQPPTGVLAFAATGHLGRGHAEGRPVDERHADLMWPRAEVDHAAGVTSEEVMLPVITAHVFDALVSLQYGRTLRRRQKWHFPHGVRE